MKDATRVDAQEAAQAVLTGTQALKAEADELLEFISSGNTEKFFQEVARRTRETMQRHYREHWASDIANRTASYWQFPYTAASRTLLAYDEHRFGNISDAEATEALEPRTWSAFKTAHDRVLTHFGKVLDAIEGGTFTDDSGARPLRVDFGTDKDGQTVAIDIAPAIRALAERGYNSLEIFGNFDPPLCSVTYVDDEGLIYDEPADDWPSGDFAIERNGKGRYSLVVPDYDEGGVSYSFEYDPREEWSFAYLLLCALVADLDCAKSVRACAYPKKRTRVLKEITAQTSFMATDEVSRRLFSKDEDRIEPYQYHAGEAITLYPNKDKGLQLLIVNDMPIDTVYEAYALDSEAQFWHEMLWSLVYNDGKEPKRTVWGHELLKQAGWANPYTKKSEDLYRRAYGCLDKLMTANRIAIRKDPNRPMPRGLKATSIFSLQPIVGATPDFIQYEDGTTDFVLNMNVPDGGDALDALPLARFAMDSGEIIRSTKGEFDFPGLRLRMEHRLMWRYVWRRANQKRTNQKILFETLFRNINLENIERHKRQKMLTTLRKMLDERKAQGVLRYTWHRNEKTRSDEGVTITLTKNLPESTS